MLTSASLVIRNQEINSGTTESEMLISASLFIRDQKNSSGSLSRMERY